VKHQSLKSFLDWILRPKIYNLVQFTIPENELKATMVECFYEIRPIVEDFQLAVQIKEAEKYTPIPKPLREIGNIKEALELIDML